MVEVERRRQDLVADRERQQAALEAAGGAEQVPGRRLGRGDRELARRGRRRRCLIACTSAASPSAGRGAVGVDVVDRLRAASPASASALASPAPRPGLPDAAPRCGRRRRSCRSRRSRRRSARRARRAASSSSSTRMPAPSPITKPSRSLSQGREARCGSSLRVDRARIDGEAGHRERRDHRFGAAGDHGVGVAVLDQPEGIAHRVQAGGAGGRRGAVRALARRSGSTPGRRPD